MAIRSPTDSPVPEARGAVPGGVARRERSDPVWRGLTLGPALLIFALLTILPILNLLAMSVYQVTWTGGQASWEFTGLRHFLALGNDVLFRASIRNTAIFAIAAVGAQMVLGFILALLTSQVVHGRVIYRTVFLLPILIPGIVIGAIWKLMYNFDFGIINQIAAVFGVAPTDWLGEPSLALGAVIIVDIWHWTPFCFLLLLAGIESLPRDVYEAAEIDGASAWQRLVHITLPLMLPTIVVTFVFRLILAFKVFDEVYLLTGGGPGTATEVLSFTIYRRFFTEDRVGYGSAMSIVALVVLALAIILAMAASRRRGARA